MATQTLDQWLKYAQSLGLARLDAQMLLLNACGQDPLNRAWLLAHDNDSLSAEQTNRAQQSILRRLAGEPVAYLVGFKEFFGLRLNVDSRVLDPRDDTETLVEWALELIAPDADWDILDLGTGSGAIALAVKTQRPNVRITATDASADALAVARHNAEQLKLPVHFVQTDAAQPNWFANLSEMRFNMILSNPPYIAQGDAHLAALKHEPAMALASGADGLEAIRDIIDRAPRYLQPGGWLLIEHGYDQGQAVRGLLDASGFKQATTRKDLGDMDRCTGAMRSA